MKPAKFYVCVRGRRVFIVGVGVNLGLDGAGYAVEVIELSIAHVAGADLGSINAGGHLAGRERPYGN